MSRQRRNFSAKFKSDLVMTFGYLWNAVRVQGGAYGTGMGARLNGNLFSYSYRDPNLENTRDRKSTRLNSSHTDISRMPSSA